MSKSNPHVRALSLGIFQAKIVKPKKGKKAAYSRKSKHKIREE